MARPYFVDGGDGLQIWRVVVNVLNNHPWTAGKGRSFNLNDEACNSSPRRILERNVTQGLGLGRILWIDLNY
jgi:hypothetical protein